MALVQRGLEEFSHDKDRLSEVLEGLSKVFALLGEDNRAKHLHTEYARLAEERFRIVVMGAMKRGKSTLLNAMLGEKALPMQPSVACTAVPISLRYGEQKHAICHRRSGEEPLEFDWSLEPGKLRDALTIPRKYHPHDAEEEAIARDIHPFTRAELFAPIKLLRNGVEILDTPGLNEDTRRSEITWELVQNSDAVILVFDIDYADLETDREDLGRIIKEGRDPRVLFAIWNRVEDLRTNRQAYERAKEDAYGLLDTHSVPRDHVFFVSAKQALKGRIQNDAAATAESGVEEFESALGAFLVHEKGSAKLITPLRIAEHAVKEAMIELPAWGSRCLAPLQKIEAVAATAREQVSQAERIREQLLGRIERSTAGVVRESTALTKLFFEETATGVPDVMKSVDIGTTAAIFKTKESAQKLVDTAEDWIAARASSWEQQELQPLIEEFATEIGGHVTEAVIELQGIIERMPQPEQTDQGGGNSITGPGIPADGSLVEIASLRALAEDTSWISRGELDEVASSGGAGSGLIIGGMAGLWVAVVFAMPLVPLILAAAIVGGIMGGIGAADVLRRLASSRVQTAIRDKSPNLLADLKSRIDENGRRVVHSVETQLEKLFEELRASIQEHDRRESEGQQRAMEHRELQDHLRSRLESYMLKLAELRSEIDPDQNTDDLATKIATTLELKPAALVEDLPAAVIELKSIIGEDTMKQFESCEAYLSEKGEWTATMMEDFAAFWMQSLERLDPKATEQSNTLLAVGAKAVSEGQALPPHPTVVRKRWRGKDPEYAVDIIRLYCLLTDDQTGVYFKGTPSNPGGGLDKFLASYRRAFQKMYPDCEEFDRGRSVIDDKDREPYSPPE